MIVLTGDVHHMSLKTNDQKDLPDTEARSALEYVEIAESYGIQSTLFCSGMLGLQEPGLMKTLTRKKSVEVGGHNFSCFQPLLYHRICKKVLRAFHGPALQQYADIMITRKILAKISGKTIQSWRNHAYLFDRNTHKMLVKSGIQFYSDVRDKDCIRPFKKDGLVYVPMNVMPDHEHLYHGHRTPEKVAKQNKKYPCNDCWGPLSFHGKEFGEQIVEQTFRITEQEGIAVLLLHPGCMKVLDNFSTFRWILSKISSLSSIWMNQVPF